MAYVYTDFHDHTWLPCVLFTR